MPFMKVMVHIVAEVFQNFHSWDYRFTVSWWMGGNEEFARKLNKSTLTYQSKSHLNAVSSVGQCFCNSMDI